MQHDETLGETIGVPDIHISKKKQLVQTRLLLICPAPLGRTCKPLALLPPVACVGRPVPFLDDLIIFVPCILDGPSIPPTPFSFLTSPLLPLVFRSTDLPIYRSHPVWDRISSSSSASVFFPNPVVELRVWLCFLFSARRVRQTVRWGGFVRRPQTIDMGMCCSVFIFLFFVFILFLRARD
jgi:hypothetical protein